MADLSPGDWIIAIAPLVVLGGLIWLLIHLLANFMKKQTDNANRQLQALERIAAALEKRQ